MTPSEIAALPRVTYTNLGDDFSPVHAHIDATLHDTEQRLLGRQHTHLIGGKPVAEGPPTAVRSPIHDAIILGEFPIAAPGQVASAIAAARAAAPDWRARTFPSRIGFLRAGARALAAKKYEIAIACLIEVGKSRLEAVGEVEEAIDLIEYYCTEMERHNGFAMARPAAISGETSTLTLRPYGVFAVISPFNFPVALTLGMTAAALIAGNTVVLKPGEASGLTASLLVSCLAEGGLPDGVLNLIFGNRQTGQALTAGDVDGIAITGSHAAGMDIHRRIAGGSYARPVLAEMGGKNPAFVTHSANLEDAALGVMRSAFGLQGQKCSALSKCYVDRRIADPFLDRLIALTASIPIGDPRSAKNFMGPVIDATAADRFSAAVAEIRCEGRMLAGGDRLAGGIFDHGAYLAPTIVGDLPADHRLNQVELFLPLLSVLFFENLDNAIEDANRGQYGLTAGIYTADPAELALFLDRIDAGVLYGNRASGATTGAWPGIQSFCGWKGSGLTGKGGLGPWYLPQFMREQSHTIFARPAQP
ncbi:MAG: aldehyde dehydrogenase family protein [Rhodospirillales bacterium]